MGEIEEQVIDGVLCWREGEIEWTQFTQRELTEMLMETRRAYNESHAGWMKWDSLLTQIANKINALQRR